MIPVSAFHLLNPKIFWEFYITFPRLPLGLLALACWSGFLVNYSSYSGPCYYYNLCLVIDNKCYDGLLPLWPLIFFKVWLSNQASWEYHCSFSHEKASLYFFFFLFIIKLFVFYIPSIAFPPILSQFMVIYFLFPLFFQIYAC